MVSLVTTTSLSLCLSELSGSFHQFFYIEEFGVSLMDNRMKAEILGHDTVCLLWKPCTLWSIKIGYFHSRLSYQQLEKPPKD